MGTEITQRFGEGSFNSHEISVKHTMALKMEVNLCEAGHDDVFFVQAGYDCKGV